MKQIFLDTDMKVSDYLKDLYDNTPIFDEIPPNFKQTTSKPNLWGILS